MVPLDLCAVSFNTIPTKNLSYTKHQSEKLRIILLYPRMEVLIASVLLILNFHMELCDIIRRTHVVQSPRGGKQHEGNTEVRLKVGSPVAFIEAGGEVYKD